MAIIRDRDLVADWNDMPASVLRKCIAEHQQSIPRLNELERYYLGKHPILNRTMDSDTGLPNHRLVANHAKYITDIVVGYMVGDPVKYSGGNIEPVLEVYDKIDIVSHDTELAKDLSMYGVGLELYYMSSDESPYPKATVIDPRQLFLVVDDTIEYRPIFGVHYYPRKDGDGNIVKWSVNVYTENMVLYYEVKNISSEAYELIDVREHFFGGVPVVEFWNNEEQQGDFEQQLSLIDAYNTLQSDRVNDKAQFVDAILKIVGASLGDTEDEYSKTIQMLKKYKVLELPPNADADAGWLTKALNEADTEVLRNAIKSDIHEFSMVPDLTDENFASNVSGVAMRYKLFGLDTLSKTKDRYFIQGLRERLKLFANVLRVKGKAVNVDDVEITMTHELPADDVEKANVVVQLKDLVSDETLLSQISFVKDPAEELKRVAKQRKEAAKQQQQAFGMPMDGGSEGSVTDDEAAE
ncbi:phage portal protein [Paenibacillus thailandensis]|uniref:Phage portal protein n=1 Tax=Paenibacillus thailandensis TaxID=393250 RepID=A0ABW5QSY1_9BACL